MLPVRLLRMTESHSETPSGQQKVFRYAQRVKDDETFLAIIVILIMFTRLAAGSLGQK